MTMAIAAAARTPRAGGWAAVWHQRLASLGACWRLASTMPPTRSLVSMLAPLARAPVASHSHSHSHSHHRCLSCSADDPAPAEEPPLPQVDAAIEAASILADHERFAALELSLLDCGSDRCGQRWGEAVRALAEMRQLSLPSPSRTPNMPPRPRLTLHHFHSTLQAILYGCTAAAREADSDSDLHYPPLLLASHYRGDLLSCCMGVSLDDPTDTSPSSPPSPLSSPSSSSSPPPPPPSSSSDVLLRQFFQPDFRFYKELLLHIERSFGPNESDSGLATLDSSSPEPLWDLIMALEARRRPKLCQESLAEMGEQEPTEAPAALPTLALVRHLFAAILEVGLRPSRQTINYVLAICDAHAHVTSLSRADEHEPALAPPPPASVDMAFIWRLWNELELTHSVHPDLLSQVLMLRICFHHRQYGYMGRVLSNAQARSSLLRIAQPMLNHHVFSEAHLVMDALKHSSKVSARIHSNERMEFLGDSVLDVLVREMIVDHSTQRSGGLKAASSDPPLDCADTLALLKADLLSSQVLARIKGKHVSHRVLAGLSRAIGLSDLLLAANKGTRTSLAVDTDKPQQPALHSKRDHSSSRNTPQRDEWKDRPLEEEEEEDGEEYEEEDEEASLQSTKAVPDSLAEDVFEACVAALFLDTPPGRDAHAVAQAVRTPDLPAAALNQNADPVANAVSLAANLTHQQAYGVSAARGFVRRAMARDLLSDCAQALNLHERQQSGQSFKRTRKASSVLSSADDRADFDHRINYKRILDLYTRITYTDEQGVCRAHVLYVFHGQIGAHRYRVRVVLKVLPKEALGGDVPSRVLGFDGQVDSASMNGGGGGQEGDLHYLNFLRYMERRRLRAKTNAEQRNAHLQTNASALMDALDEGANDATSKADAEEADADEAAHEETDASSPSSSLLSQHISFSVSPGHVPELDSACDRRFPIALAQPEQASAEQKAAFYALQELGVLPSSARKGKPQQLQQPSSKRWKARR